MSAPIFTDANGRHWSLGSAVIARWWSSRPERGPSGDVRVSHVELEAVGRVASLSLVEGEWRVGVSLGPAFDHLEDAPVGLSVCQIEALPSEASPAPPPLLRESPTRGRLKEPEAGAWGADPA